MGKKKKRKGRGLEVESSLEIEPEGRSQSGVTDWINHKVIYGHGYYEVKDTGLQMASSEEDRELSDTKDKCNWLHLVNNVGLGLGGKMCKILITIPAMQQ